MDEEALNELLECSVCLDRLDTTSKVLPCQHTFCKRCLDEIVSTKSELRCPECRALVEIPVDELPSNILLMRLLEGIHQKARGIGGSANSTPMTVLASLIASKPVGSVGTSSGSSGKTFQKVSGPARQSCAKGVYNYDGSEPGDLSFKKNDIINLHKQVDDNWFHGELNGQLGFFPASYVQVITPLPDNNPRCKALYNFQIEDKSEKGCLTFQKDDVLTVMRRIDDNWAEGRLGDKIGIFPIAFVEMNDAGKDLMSKSSLNIMNTDNRGSAANTDQSSTDPGGGTGDSLPPMTSPSSGPPIPRQVVPGGSGDAPRQTSPPLYVHKRHSLTIPSTPPVAVQPNRYSAELISTFTAPPVPTPASATVMTSSPAVSVTSATTVPKAVSQNSQIPNLPPRTPTTPTTPSGHTLGPPPSTPPPPPPPLFVALYHYKPVKEDEIQLYKGDYYTVTEKCQDGWFKGACLKSGKIGVFPGNYVQLVRHKHSLVTTPVTPTTPNQAPSSAAHHHPPPQRSPGSSPSISANTHSHALSASTNTTMVLNRPAVSPSQSGLSASLDYQVNSGTRAPAVLPRKAASRSATTPTTGPPPISQPPPIIPRNASSQGTNLHVDLPARPQILPNEQRSKRRNSAPPERISPRPAAPLPIGVTETPTSRQHSPRSGTMALDSVVPPRSVVYNRPLPATPTSSTSSSFSSRHGHSHGHGHATSLHSGHPGTTVTPPNVVAGAIASISSSSKDKRDKKEKEKSSSFMKRFTGSGKSKHVKGKTPPPPPPPAKVFHQIGPQQSSDGFSHSKSASLTAEESSVVPPVTHKKSSSIDASATSAQPVPKKPKPLPKERYRCIVPYPPQTNAELELKIGDIIYVHKKREDGWFKGILARNGTVGLFPGSFVERYM